MAAGRPPLPPVAPPGSPFPDPNDPYRKLRAYDPDAVAYQESVFAANDQRRSNIEVSRGRQFERTANTYTTSQLADLRAARRANNANTDPLAVNFEDRYADPQEMAARERYQRHQLADARTKFGETYGIAGDELAANRRAGRPGAPDRAGEHRHRRVRHHHVGEPRAV